MYEIYVYGPKEDDNDYSTAGLAGALTPTQCTFEEGGNEESTISMTHPLDEYGRYGYLQRGNILSVPVPVRTTPEIQNGSCVTTVWSYKVKALNLLTSKNQRTLYKKAKGSGRKKILSAGEVVTVVEKPTGDDVRWKVKSKYGTGYMDPNGLELMTEHTIPDNSSAIEEVASPWTVMAQYFRIYEVVKNIDSVEVSARHISYDLLYNQTRYESTGTVTLQTALDGVLNNCYAPHDFRAYTNVNNEQPGLSYVGKNPIEAILDPEEGVCSKFNVKLVRDNYDLYLLNDPGLNRGVVVSYGKNMTGIKFTSNEDEVATRIIPTGEKKNGDILYLDDDPTKRYIDSPNINNYSTIRVYTLQCENCKIGDKDPKGGKITEAIAKARMREQAQKLLDNGCDQPTVSMEVEFVNLGDSVEYEQFKNLENCFLWDYILVRNPRLAVDVTAQIVKIKWDCLKQRMESVEIGTIGKTLANTGITTWQIPSGLNGSKIAYGSIGSAALKSDIIAAKHVQADSISTEALQAGIVIADKIAANAVTTEKLNAESVTSDKIAAGVISTKHLEAESVTTEKLAAKAVTTDKLETESVTSEKIAANSIKTTHLDAESVTAEKIKTGSITADRMKAKTITAESGILADGVVGTAQIADSTITSAKIVSLNADVITAGTLSVKRLILVGEDGLIYNINASAAGLSSEELTDEKYQNQINGTVIVAKSITAAQIAAESITGNEILAQSITAGNIDVAGLFADEATINAINAMDISSNNYLKLMVETAVNDVQVGGRNYLLGTGDVYVARSDGSARTWLFPWKCADEDTAHSLYGKTITISFDYDQAITSGSFTLAFHHTWGTVKIFNAGTATGQRFEETFDLPVPDAFAENDPDVVIYIDGTWNGSVTFRNLKMEIGNKATDWTPAPEDGYKSSYIEIRDDHVDINTGGRFKVTSGDVDISTSKFSVSITDEEGGEDELLTIDATGVRAANLSAPNVAMRYDGPWQIIVNSGATSAQVESGSYVRSMQEAFDRLNDRFLPYYAEVKLETDTYENVNIHGIYAGPGDLQIVGQGHTVYGKVVLQNVNAHVTISNLKACSANGTVWGIHNSRYIYMKGCIAEGYSTAMTGYNIDQGSIVTIESCEVYNCGTGVDAGWGTNIDISIMKGTTTQYAYKVFGTRITNSGSRPSGGWTGMNFMAAPGDLLTVPIDAGSGVVVPTTGSATFNPSATGTYTTYWWSGDSDIRQGYTKSNGRIKGGIFYAVSGVSGTVKSAILKLTRLKNYGKGSAVQVKVYGTTSAGKSGNPALSTEGYVLGTIDGGQTAEFALPAALATGLGNGTYKGIVLYADDTTVLHGKTYSTNYARFTTAAPLTITWTT